MIDTPLISILMPVYNADRYIQEAVDSILSQTFSSFELIIIVDGSIDNSFSILKKKSLKDSRLICINRENKGIAKTRNELLSLANSAIIAWMDADDISSPDRIKVMYEWMKRNPEYVAIGCGTVMIDPDGLEICRWPQPKDHDGIDSWHLSGRGGAITFASSMMRSDIVRKVGGFREDLVGAEDLDLFLKIAEIGKIGNIEPPLFKYRQHVSSISHVKRREVVDNTRQVVAAALTRRGLPDNTQIRAKVENASLSQIHQKWAWWALGAGNKNTALKHARIAFLQSPGSWASWKLLACALRGR